MMVLEALTIAALITLLIGQEFLNTSSHRQSKKLSRLLTISIVPLLILFGVLIGSRWLVLLH